MASWTDIIPKFNPYVQQLPVEAMVQVGMAKQQAYEQNVTKIQSQIDAIGGLDVSRDVDRKYLQSKLDELGNKLTTLASGDFSNFQLVNAVGGMTNQIVKDDVVKTAVNSTAWAKKQKEKIEKGKADGTWSIENEDLYNTQYSKWYNSTQAGESFSSEYIPYRDVYKKLKEIAKDVGVDENLVQNLFTPDGHVNKVMVETYSKGKDANKIYEAFVNGIDESDYRQLAITGRYKYKGYTNEQLIENLQTSNNDFTAAANARKLDLQQKLDTLDKAIPTLKKEEDKVTAENERNQILKTITNLDEQIAKSNTNFSESSTKLASGDEEYANNIRSRIHTNKFLSTLSKDFADKNSYVKYGENVLWKAIMEENKFNLDYWYKQQQVLLDKERNRISLRGVLAQEEKNKQDKEVQDRLLTPGYGKTPLPGDKPNMFGRVTGDMNTMLEERNNLLNQFAKDAFGGDGAKLEAYVKEQVKLSDGKKTERDVLTELGTQRFTQLNGLKNKNNLDPNLLKAMEEFGTMSTLIPAFQTLVNNADKNAREKAGATSAINPEELAKTLTEKEYKVERAWPFRKGDWFEGAGDWFGLPSEKTVKVTPRERVDLIQIATYNDKIFGSDTEKAIIDQKRKYFTDKYGEKITNTLVKEHLFSTSGFNVFSSKQSLAKHYIPIVGGARTLYETFKGEKGFSPEKKVAAQFKTESYSKYQNELENEMQNSFSGYYPKSRNFIMSAKNRPYIEASVLDVFAGREDYNDVAALLATDGSAITLTPTPSLTGFGANKYEVVVSGKKDGKSVVTEPLEISEEAYSYLTNEPAPRIERQQILARAAVNGSPDKSSNPYGKDSYGTSWFKSSDFSHIVDHKIVGGDFTQVKDNPNLFFLTLNYVPKGSNTPVPINIQSNFDLNSVLTAPSNLLNNNNFTQIIKERGY
jgi:DNA-binding transcriptional MerR regulator